MAEPDKDDPRDRLEAEDMEAPRKSVGEGDLRAPGDHRREDAERDEALEDTFPASDPPSASPGAD
jgi:hypothetical protein